MARKYICDNCGAEFDRLRDYLKVEGGEATLWRVGFWNAYCKPSIHKKELCKKCRDKLVKFIEDGF